MFIKLTISGAVSLENLTVVVNDLKDRLNFESDVDDDLRVNIQADYLTLTQLRLIWDALDLHTESAEICTAKETLPISIPRLLDGRSNSMFETLFLTVLRRNDQKHENGYLIHRLRQRLASNNLPTDIDSPTSQVLTGNKYRDEEIIEPTMPSIW